MTNNGNYEFEELIREKRNSSLKAVYHEDKLAVAKSPILKSNKNADLEDFIGMIAKLCDSTMKKYNAQFIPDEGAIVKDPDKTLEKPTILYNIVSRVPKNELKMRHSETIAQVMDEKTGRIRHGQTWSQRQNCIVQFNIVASDYATANKVMKSFEDLMFTYTGFFKENGIAELHFLKYYTDIALDRYRQYMSVRSIQYFVEIEKLITIFDTTLEDIDI